MPFDVTNSSDFDLFKYTVKNITDQCKLDLIGHNRCILISRLIHRALTTIGYRAHLVGCWTVGQAVVEGVPYQICLVFGDHNDQSTWTPAHACVVAESKSEGWFLLDGTLSQLHHSHSRQKFPLIGPMVFPMTGWTPEEYDNGLTGSFKGVADDGTDVEIIYGFDLSEPLWFADSEAMKDDLDSMMDIKVNKTPMLHNRAAARLKRRKNEVISDTIDISPQQSPPTWSKQWHKRLPTKNAS